MQRRETTSKMKKKKEMRKRICGRSNRGMRLCWQNDAKFLIL